MISAFILSNLAPFIQNCGGDCLGTRAAAVPFSHRSPRDNSGPHQAIEGVSVREVVYIQATMILLNGMDDSHRIRDQSEETTRSTIKSLQTLPSYEFSQKIEAIERISGL